MQAAADNIGIKNINSVRVIFYPFIIDGLKDLHLFTINSGGFIVPIKGSQVRISVSKCFKVTQDCFLQCLSRADDQLCEDIVR